MSPVFERDNDQFIYNKTIDAVYLAPAEHLIAEGQQIGWENGKKFELERGKKEMVLTMLSNGATVERFQNYWASPRMKLENTYMSSN